MIKMAAATADVDQESIDNDPNMGKHAAVQRLTSDEFKVTTSDRPSCWRRPCFRTNLERVLTVIAFVLFVVCVVSLTLLALEVN